ncbi:MAG: carboxypeptidase regulatory-like domain-containing protein, partial [Pyrinomonadaceae bacterium]|nr:carboxypeptidase regulatory-like domain-containing protein [Pyrinomonadaceae bacterium]
RFAPPSSATAATVKIGGRVTTDGGRGIRSVRVTMTTQDGSTRTALTNNFGFYNFAEVAAAQTVTLNAESKRFTFIEPTRTFQMNEENLELNFVSAKQPR